MKESKDKFEFFWGGPFSQWYKSDFTIDGITYNCAEQYMMAKKALLFQDIDSHTAIMAAKVPAKQKELGRAVKNFDATKWNAVCKQYVYEANFAKFSKEPLKALLLATAEKEIVEASPYDTIWGIGLSEHNDDRFDKSKWKGTNWLGEVLMQVRDALRK